MWADDDAAAAQSTGPRTRVPVNPAGPQGWALPFGHARLPEASEGPSVPGEVVPVSTLAGVRGKCWAQGRVGAGGLEEDIGPR